MTRKSIHIRTVFGVAAVVALSLAGCREPNPDPRTPPREVATEQSVQPADVAGEDAATPEPEATPAGLPDDLPDIAMPFYMPAELVATPSTGDPWVLEFVTDDELTLVNNTVADRFSEEHGWHDVSREVTGQQTVTMGSRDGYLLVIAVAPEPMDDFKTSLYYTLSTQ